MAAVLACGDGAALSHGSAAALWSLSPKSPTWVHVTVPGNGGRRRRKGIVVHRSTTITADDVTRHRGIPTTTPARTRRDLGYGPEPTRSDLERLFLRICRTNGIPKPEVNARVGPYTVDFLWREERLIVELDSWAYHRTRASFEADRARDRQLTRMGFTIMRVADRELLTAPRAVVRDLTTRLA